MFNSKPGNRRHANLVLLFLVSFTSLTTPPPLCKRMQMRVEGRAANPNELDDCSAPTIARRGARQKRGANLSSAETNAMIRNLAEPNFSRRIPVKRGVSCNDSREFVRPTESAKDRKKTPQNEPRFYNELDSGTSLAAAAQNRITSSERNRWLERKTDTESDFLSFFLTNLTTEYAFQPYPRYRGKVWRHGSAGKGSSRPTDEWCILCTYTHILTHRVPSSTSCSLLRWRSDLVNN